MNKKTDDTTRSVVKQIVYLTFDAAQDDKAQTVSIIQSSLISVIGTLLHSENNLGDKLAAYGAMRAQLDQAMSHMLKELDMLPKCDFMEGERVKKT